LALGDLLNDLPNDLPNVANRFDVARWMHRKENFTNNEQKLFWSPLSEIGDCVGSNGKFSRELPMTFQP